MMKVLAAYTSFLIATVQVNHAMATAYTSIIGANVSQF